MTDTVRLELVALDATDIVGLASFYAELTGWEITSKDSDWITLRAGDGQEVAFQQAPEHIPPKWPGQERPQQVHLDLLVDGYRAAAERAVASARPGSPTARPGSRWPTRPAIRSTCASRTASAR